MVSELEKLKRKAAKLYQQTQDFDQFSCGRQMAEYIKPEIGLARIEFNKVWKRISELDPTAPSNPLPE